MISMCSAPELHTARTHRTSLGAAVSWLAFPCLEMELTALPVWTLIKVRGSNSAWCLGDEQYIYSAHVRSCIA